MVVPKVELPYSAVLTSAHSDSFKSGVIALTNQISHQQVVVAVGENSWLEPGDHVQINVDMFKTSSKPGKHDIGNKITVHPPLEKIGSTDYLYMTDRHIKWKLLK